MYDKSVRAFVSFVRFYSKHNYHLIFNIKGQIIIIIVNKYHLKQICLCSV